MAGNHRYYLVDGDFNSITDSGVVGIDHPRI